MQGNVDFHDFPNFSSDLLVDNKQTPLIFSSEYFSNSHHMFRRSGPGHMLLHTDFQGKLINKKKYDMAAYKIQMFVALKHIFIIGIIVG